MTVAFSAGALHRSFAGVALADLPEEIAAFLRERGLTARAADGTEVALSNAGGEEAVTLLDGDDLAALSAVVAGGEAALRGEVLELARDELQARRASRAAHPSSAPPASSPGYESGDGVAGEVDRLSALARDDATRASDAALRSRAARAGVRSGGRPASYVEHLACLAGAPWRDILGLTAGDVQESLEECSDYGGLVPDDFTTSWYRPGADAGPPSDGLGNGDVVAASRVLARLRGEVPAGDGEVLALTARHAGEFGLAAGDHGHAPHVSHRHAHDFATHDGHGPELEYEETTGATTHSHPHGAEGHQHGHEGLSVATGPDGDEYPVRDYRTAEPDDAAAEVDRLTAVNDAMTHIAPVRNVHGKVNTVVTSATRAHAGESFSDTRQPRRGAGRIPATSESGGDHQPPWPFLAARPAGQRDRGLASLSATEDELAVLSRAGVEPDVVAADVDRLVRLYDGMRL